MRIILLLFISAVFGGMAQDFFLFITSFVVLLLFSNSQKQKEQVTQLEQDLMGLRRDLFDEQASVRRLEEAVFKKGTFSEDTPATIASQAVLKPIASQIINVEEKRTQTDNITQAFEAQTIDTSTAPQPSEAQAEVAPVTLQLPNVLATDTEQTEAIEIEIAPRTAEIQPTDKAFSLQEKLDKALSEPTFQGKKEQQKQEVSEPTFQGKEEKEQELSKAESWEAFVGTKLLSYLGIGILVIGLVSLLTYSLTQMNVLGRSITGLTCGAALLGIGFFLERKENYTLFGRILMGGGWAILYFLAFGMYHIKGLKVLTSPYAGTALLAVVASLMIMHTLKYRSEATTGVALLLSFITLYVSDVSLYTHVASLVIAGVISFFAWRFQWHKTRLIGVLLLYAGYGTWLFFQGSKSLPEFKTEHLITSVLLIALWVFFKLPDFAKLKLDSSSKETENEDGSKQGIKIHWEERLVPIIGLFNLAGLALVRKVIHYIYHTKGTPSAALYLAAVYLFFAQIMRLRGRQRVYKLEMTISVLLAMVGLWSVIDPYHLIMGSWLTLGAAIFGYSFIRRDRYFRDLGFLVSATSTLLVLGGEYPKQGIKWIYSLASGEMLLKLPSSLPEKGIVLAKTSGITGLIGASVLFVMGFITYLYLKQRNQEHAKGEYSRDLLLTYFSTTCAMIGLYKILPGVQCVFSWFGLGILLFQYGLYRKQFAIRTCSHIVLLWATVTGKLLGLSTSQLGLTLATGAGLLYLDAFLTFRLKSQVSEGEKIFEKIITVGATIALVISTYVSFPLYYAIWSWMGVAALLFYYDAVRKDDMVRWLSHGLLLFATLYAFIPILQEKNYVKIFGDWMVNPNVLLLFGAIVLFHFHAFLVHFFLKSRKTAVMILEEEGFLASVGNIIFLIVCWYTLPKIGVALAYALIGVLMLELGLIWKRPYLQVHASITLLLSGGWALTVNAGAAGLLKGFSRRLLSAVPILALWSYASYTWNKHVQSPKEQKIKFESWMPTTLSSFSFVMTMVLIYFHAHGKGLGWMIYGLLLLLAILPMKQGRYGIQSLIAAMMASFSLCHIAQDAHLPFFQSVMKHPALPLGILLLFGYHLIAKGLRSHLKQLVESTESSIHRLLRKFIQRLRTIYGLLFCFVFIFTVTVLLKQKMFALGWGLTGLVLAWYGLSGREKRFRWIAMGLFAFAVGKILFVDIFSFSTQQRIITFISVGIALLTISFLYNRIKDRFSKFLADD